MTSIFARVVFLAWIMGANGHAIMRQSLKHRAATAAAKNDARVSLRENMCRRLIGYWAERGVVSLGLVCRQAYSDAACNAAEVAFGGEWPDRFTAQEFVPGDVATAACSAIEHSLSRRRSLMLRQQKAQVYQLSNKTESIAKVGEIPGWAKLAPVLWEDPEASEAPQPLELQPPSWSGPALTPSAMQTWLRTGGTQKPIIVEETTTTTIM